MAIDGNAQEMYDDKGNAKHYDTDRINDIVKMERIWGTKHTMIWCEITAFKYRMRIGKKVGQSMEQEIIKTSWYERMALHLKTKLGTKKEILAPLPEECGNPFMEKE